MKTQSWTFTDKSSWPRGAWDSEPDKMQWLDKATGLPCLIVRGPSGALCGYVGVSSTHPMFGASYESPEVEVHGGLTYADPCSTHDPEHGICHVVEPGEDDRVWWFGFDCAHDGDFCPQYAIEVHDYETYKTFSYVTAEVTALAAQLAGCA